MQYQSSRTLQTWPDLYGQYRECFGKAPATELWGFRGQPDASWPLGTRLDRELTTLKRSADDGGYFEEGSCESSSGASGSPTTTSEVRTLTMYSAGSHSCNITAHEHVCSIGRTPSS